MNKTLAYVVAFLGVCALCMLRFWRKLKDGSAL